MKKAILYLAIIVTIPLLLVECNLRENKVNAKAYLNEYGLKGNIKEMTKKIYDIKTENGNIIKVLQASNQLAHQVMSFDGKGNLEQIAFYGHDQKLSMKHTYDINHHGKVSQEKVYNSEGKDYRIIQFTYDDIGNKTQIVQKDNDKIVVKAEFKYDSKSNLIEEITNDYHNVSVVTEKFKFDDQSKELSWEYFTNEDPTVPSQKYLCKYDEKGQLSERQWFHNEQPYITYVYTYTNGKMTEEKVLDNTGHITAIKKSTYDNSGRLLLKSESSGEPSTAVTYTYKYDSQGLKMEELITDFQGKPTFVNRYKYDQNGNEVEMASFEIKKQGTEIKEILTTMNETIYSYVNS